MKLTDIRAKYFNGGYTVKLDIPATVGDDYVFNEDLTVKQNRELVKRHNEEVKKRRKYVFDLQAELDRQLTLDVTEYVVDNYDLTEKQAQKVVNFAYQEHHSCMSDYFCYINVYAEFACELIKTCPCDWPA